MTGLRLAVERVGIVVLPLSLGLTLFNLPAAEILFGLAAIAWLILTVTDDDRPGLPAFAWPLSAYAVWTILSALFSLDRAVSVPDLKQLVLLLMVPVVMRLARGRSAMRTLDVVIAMGAAGAVLGAVHMARFGFDLDNRAMGTLTHYMTYSGVIMLVLCAAAARLVFPMGQWLWPAITVPVLCVALASTSSRNAWIGAVIGIGALLALRRLRLLVIIPVLVVLVLLLGPASVRHRALSVVDTTDASNRDRLTMLSMGAAMVRDHPVFGVGPDMVIHVYPQYRPPDAVHPVNVHLHNVPVQIAAERGLPALALWLAFVATAVVGLWRQVRHGPVPALAAAGLAGIAAMLSAGMFEYNFGDSEFLMLFLGLITLPYAARLPVAHRVPAATMPPVEQPHTA